MIGWIISHPNVSVWITGMCEDVHLHSQRDSADGIKYHEIGKLLWIIQVGPLNFITSVSIRQRDLTPD